MANLVGQIKGYHSGVKHLANIYDAKQTTIGAANVLMHFDSSPTRDECGNTWNDYGTNKCLALNGSSYLQTTNITLGGKDFTIDFWGYMSSASGNWSRFFSIFDNLNSGGNRIWIGRNETSNNLLIDVLDSVSWSFADAWKDRFNHYAIVYQHSASTIAFYVNGQLISSQSLSIAVRTLKNCWIGRSEYTADANLTGFIDDFRISNGIARWTANFTPPARGSISKDANTTALLKFDTDTTTDECGNTWTAYGSPYLSSSVVTVAQTKFGKALALDGTNYLQMSNAYNFGTNDFTIDCWCFLKSQSVTYPTVFSTVKVSSGYNGLALQRWNDGTIRLTIDNQSDQRILGGVSFGAFSLNEWHHIAIVRNGSNIYAFLDGVRKVMSTNFNTNVGYGDGNYMIGSNPWYPQNYYWNGYIDEFRIVVGKAMWTADFTPPTSAYTTTTGASTVNANMMIRHNNANCYIPLTTNAAHTTAPYIAIRHGSTNYFTVK